MTTKRSEVPTAYAVNCTDPFGLGEGTGCGLVYMTTQEYGRQLLKPDRTWRCPSCGGEAFFDDENYESFYAHQS